MYEKEIVSELEKMDGKTICLLIDGMINFKIIIDKLKFEILHNILKLHDDHNNYFVFNTNQITKISVDKSIRISTDNDMIIFLKEIKNAY